MRGTGKKQTILMQWAIILLAFGGLIYWLASSASGALGAEDLQMEAASLRSYAGEAAMLAQGVESGKVTRNYLAAETLLVQDKARMSLESLASARVESGLENELAQTRSLAQDVKRTLESLSTASGESAVATRVRGEAEALVARSLSLEESLKRRKS